MRVNIIGGGLAGCALAYVLKNAGVTPVIYEASLDLACGASGNDVGLYTPRFSALWDAPAQFYSEAFFQVLTIFEKLGGDIDWLPCGVLSLINNERSDIRYRKTIKNWEWSPDDMRIVSALEASSIAGVEISCAALYTPRSGSVSPRKLCYAYAKGVDVHLNARVDDIKALDGDVTILACGLGCLKFEDAAQIPLKAVRGQVTYIAESGVSRPLQAALSYGGYFAPAKNGVHCVGATFQPWLTTTGVVPEDDVTNLEKLFESVPSLFGAYDVVGQRASVRTTSRDHFPVVGQLSQGVYISTGHGSHGILSTALSAVMLSNKILGKGDCVSGAVIKALCPSRFS